LGGNFASFVAVGDFNGDGIPDLAVAFVRSGVSILLGNGNSGFSAAPGSPPATGSYPVFVAVGDFNGDGIEDLAIANETSNNITVLLGNGSGGFTPAVGSPIAVGTGPTSVAVGDFNGDGNQDLAIVSTEGNSVTILLGNGVGEFTAAAGSPYSVPFPQSLAVGDFNGDGFQDLAIANGYNNVTVLLGNGSGGFASSLGRFTTDLSPVSIAVADFNGDGIADIVTANEAGNDATVLLGGKTSTNSALSTSPLTVNFGQPVSLTLTVSDAGPAFAVPTGAATLFDGAHSLGTGTLTGSPLTFSVAALAVGEHFLTATYAGDTRSLGSTSNRVTLQVNAVPVSCALTQTENANVADVQSIINQALGMAPPANDLNEDLVVNIVDVQVEIDAALNLGCSAG
jgi:hypothetical protein